MVNHKPYTKTTLISTKNRKDSNIIVTLLMTCIDLLIEPIKSFIKTIATTCTSCLDVPSTVSERVEIQLVCYLSGIHCIWQILKQEKQQSRIHNVMFQMPCSGHSLQQNNYMPQIVHQVRTGNLFYQSLYLKYHSNTTQLQKQSDCDLTLHWIHHKFQELNIIH